MNKVLLEGHLGKDPVMKHTPSGATVVNFSIATKETYSKNGEKHEKTEWHNIVVWGKNAENAAKYLKKGSHVFIEGSLQTRSYDDKNGVKKYTTEIVAKGLKYLSSSKGNNPTQESHDNSENGDDNLVIEADSRYSSNDIDF